jgi:hypothetical protein
VRRIFEAEARESVGEKKYNESAATMKIPGAGLRRTGSPAGHVSDFITSSFHHRTILDVAFSAASSTSLSADRPEL